MPQQNALYPGLQVGWIHSRYSLNVHVHIKSANSPMSECFCPNLSIPYLLYPDPEYESVVYLLSCMHGLGSIQPAHLIYLLFCSYHLSFNYSGLLFASIQFSIYEKDTTISGFL